MALLNLNRIRHGWDMSEIYPKKDEAIRKDDDSAADFEDGLVSLPGQVVVSLNADRFKQEMGDPDSTAAYIVGQIAMDPDVAPTDFFVEPGEVDVVPAGELETTAPAPLGERSSVERVGRAFNRFIYGNPEGRSAFGKKSKGLKDSKEAAFGRQIDPKFWQNPVFGYYPDLNSDEPMYIHSITGSPAKKIGSPDSRVVKARFRGSDTDYEFGWDALRGAMFHTGYDTTFKDALWTSVLEALATAWTADQQANPDVADAAELLDFQSYPDGEVAKFFQTVGAQIPPMYYPKVIKDMLQHELRPRSGIQKILEFILKIPDYARGSFIERLQVDDTVKSALIKALTSGDVPSVLISDLISEKAGLANRSEIAPEIQQKYEENLLEFQQYAKAKSVRDAAVLAKTKAVQLAGKGDPPSSTEMAELMNDADTAEYNGLAMERLFWQEELRRQVHSEAATFLAMGLGGEGGVIPSINDTREGHEGEELEVWPWAEATADREALARGDVAERSKFDLVEQTAKVWTPQQLDHLQRRLLLHQTMVRRENVLGRVLVGLASTRKQFVTKAHVLNRYKSLIWTPLAARFPNDRIAYQQAVGNVIKYAGRSDYVVAEGKIMEDTFIRSIEQWDVLTSNLINRGLLSEIRDLPPGHAEMVKSQYDSWIADLEKSIIDANRFSGRAFDAMKKSLKGGYGIPREISELPGANEPVDSSTMAASAGPIGADEKGEVESGGTEPLYVGMIGAGDTPDALTSDGMAALENADPMGGRAQLLELRRNAEGILVYDSPLDILESLYFSKSLVTARSKGVHAPISARSDVDSGAYLAFQSENAVQQVTDNFTDEGELNFIAKFHPLTTMQELDNSDVGKTSKPLRESKMAVLVEDRGVYRIKTFTRSASKLLSGQADRRAAMSDRTKLQKELEALPTEATTQRALVQDKIDQINNDLSSRNFWRVTGKNREQAAEEVIDFINGWPERLAEIKAELGALEKGTEPGRNKRISLLKKEITRLENSLKFDKESHAGVDKDRLINGIKTGIQALREKDEDGRLINFGGTAFQSLWDHVNESDFEMDKFLRIEGALYDIPLEESADSPTGWAVPDDMLEVEKNLQEAHTRVNLLERAYDLLASVYVETAADQQRGRKKTQVEAEEAVFKVGVPFRTRDVDEKKAQWLRENTKRGRFLASRLLGLAEMSPWKWEILPETFTTEDEAKEYIKDNHLI